MNEPQVWTLIGVFATGLFAMLTLMSTMFVRILRTEIGSLHVEIGRVETTLRSEIGRVEMTLSTKIDHLDRDVSAMAKRVFPDPPAA